MQGMRNIKNIIPAVLAAALAGGAQAGVNAAPTARGWVSTILMARGPISATQEAQVRALGADVTRHLPIIRALEVRVPARSLSRLATLPFVSRLSEDGTVTKCDEFTTEGSGAVAAGQQYGVTGAGVTVAVVDSGIAPCDDLGGRLLASVDLTAKPSSGDPCGHGTHVAGIIAGNGVDSSDKHCFRTFSGVAPAANVVSVRVLDRQGGGTVGTALAGVQWVVNNAARYHIRVLNLSMGHPVTESYTQDPLCQAVEAAYRAGIVVVCAAGNEGRLNPTTNTPGLDNEGWGTAYGSINSPGNDPYVITVGAMKGAEYNGDGSYDVNGRAGDKVATYSSRGPSRLDLVLKPDIVAPGNQVLSLESPGSYLDTLNGGVNQISNRVYRTNKGPHASPDYFCLSGTSMASPVVAGAAALLLQQNPSLTPDTVKARLMISADKWADPSGNADPFTYGAGYLDVSAALACTVVAGQSAMSPDVSIDGRGNVTINMDRAIWGRTTVWNTGSIGDLRAIWGKAALTAGSANLLEASRAIWGKSSVWSDHSVSASTSSTASSVDLSSIALNGE